MKSILLVTKSLGLVEMTSGPAEASFSLPKWQAVKMISLHRVQALKFTGYRLIRRTLHGVNVYHLCSNEFNWLTQSQRLKRYNILLVQ